MRSTSCRDPAELLMSISPIPGPTSMIYRCSLRAPDSSSSSEGPAGHPLWAYCQLQRTGSRCRQAASCQSCRRCYRLQSSAAVPALPPGDQSRRESWGLPPWKGSEGLSACMGTIYCSLMRTRCPALSAVSVQLLPSLDWLQDLPGRDEVSRPLPGLLLMGLPVRRPVR